MPISIYTLEIEGKKGFLTILFEGGGLEVSYLGTEAPTKEAAVNPNIPLDFREIEENIQRLEAISAEKRNPNSNKPLSKPDKDLIITVRKA